MPQLWKCGIAELRLTFLATWLPYFATHPAMKELEVPQVPAWAEANRPRISWFLEMLNLELTNREFVAGDRYTVADITMQVAIDFMKPARLSIPEGAANVKR